MENSILKVINTGNHVSSTVNELENAIDEIATKANKIETLEEAINKDRDNFKQFIENNNTNIHKVAEELTESIFIVQNNLLDLLDKRYKKYKICFSVITIILVIILIKVFL